jgi:hypothetical protein
MNTITNTSAPPVLGTYMTRLYSSEVLLVALNPLIQNTKEVMRRKFLQRGLKFPLLGDCYDGVSISKTRRMSRYFGRQIPQIKW